MAITTILTSDQIGTWVTKTNTISTNLGDASLVDSNLVNEILNLDSDLGTRTSLGTTDKTDIVTAINELETAIRGSTGNYTLNTTATNLLGAINEHESDIGNMTFTGLSATDISAAVRELRTELGDHSSLGTTSTTSAVSAINELETAIRGTASNYTLNTTASNLVAAINEHETDIGTVSSLNTTATNLVGAVNELVSDLSDLDSDKSATLTTTINDLADLDSDVGTRTSLTTNTKTSLVAAINELNTEIDRNINDSAEIRTLFSLTDAGGDGSMSYNSGTGVFTYTGPSASEVRAHITAGEGIDFASGVISGEDASTTNKGIASFNSTRFSVSNGAVDVATGGIDTTQLAADAVTGAKIEDAAVDTEHLAADAVTEAKIADDAVGSAQLKNLSTLLIKNSSGTTLKTLYGAGS